MAKKKGPGFGDVLRDEVNESSAVPEGGYDLEVVEMEVATTREAGKKMLHAQLQVKAPKEWAGSRLDDYMVFGSDDDPDAEDIRTLKRSRGVKKFRNLARCAGVLDDVGDDDEENCELLQGKDVYGVVTASIEEEGDFKGEIRNRVVRYYEVGEKEPEAGELPGPGGKKSVKASLKKKKVVEEEEEEEEAPPKKKVVKKAKPVVEEEEEEDEEDEPPKKKGKPAKDDDDEDDDDDDEEGEDEDEDPPKGRRK